MQLVECDTMVVTFLNNLSNRFCRPIMTKPKPAKPATPESASPSPPQGEPQAQGAEGPNPTPTDESAGTGGEATAATEPMETEKPE